MSRNGYNGITLSSKEKKDIKIIAQIENCRTLPEAIRRLVAIYKEDKGEEFNQLLNKEDTDSSDGMSPLRRLVALLRGVSFGF